MRQQTSKPKPTCQYCSRKISHVFLKDHISQQHSSPRRCSFCGANLAENEYCYHNK